MELFVDSYALVESVENGIILFKVEYNSYLEREEKNNETFMGVICCSKPDEFAIKKGDIFILRHRGKQLIELIRKDNDEKNRRKNNKE